MKKHRPARGSVLSISGIAYQLLFSFLCSFYFNRSAINTIGKIYIGNEFTYLLPGELIVTHEALKISTILGSCVSVCLYDPGRRIAGMNHYMLPVNKNNDPDYFRYGDTSLEHMLSRMLKSGARKNDISAYVYGGSSIFMNTSHSFNTGKLNVEIALEFLQQNMIPVRLKETGGKVGRKVIFDTSAGIISSNLLQGSKDTLPPNPLS